MIAVRPRATALLLLAVVALLLPPSALADAYRWTDKEGAVYYGSKPPAGARNVVKLPAKNFSRYSSSKLLSGYRTRMTEARAAVAPAAAVEEVNLIAAVSRLEESKLVVNHNDKGHVTNCKVTVRNVGDAAASDVLVSFEFDDGSIVPAKGPQIIGGKSEGLYYIEPDHLPLVISRPQVKPLSEDAPKKSLALPKPKVIIQSSPS